MGCRIRIAVAGYKKLPDGRNIPPLNADERSSEVASIRAQLLHRKLKMVEKAMLMLMVSPISRVKSVTKRQTKRTADNDET